MDGKYSLVIDAFKPAAPGFYGDLHEKRTRPAALAELVRRGIDVAATRQEMRRLIPGIQAMPDGFDGIDGLIFGNDSDGIWRIALEIAERGAESLSWL
jgi:hypothetical protein